MKNACTRNIVRATTWACPNNAKLSFESHIFLSCQKRATTYGRPNNAQLRPNRIYLIVLKTSDIVGATQSGRPNNAKSLFEPHIFYRVKNGRPHMAAGIMCNYRSTTYIFIVSKTGDHAGSPLRGRRNNLFCIKNLFWHNFDKDFYPNNCFNLSNSSSAIGVNT